MIIFLICLFGFIFYCTYEVASENFENCEFKYAKYWYDLKITAFWLFILMLVLLIFKNIYQAV